MMEKIGLQRDSNPPDCKLNRPACNLLRYRYPVVLKSVSHKKILSIFFLKYFNKRSIGTGILLRKYFLVFFPFLLTTFSSHFEPKTADDNQPYIFFIKWF